MRLNSRMRWIMGSLVTAISIVHSASELTTIGKLSLVTDAISAFLGKNLVLVRGCCLPLVKGTDLIPLS